MLEDVPAQAGLVAGGCLLDQPDHQFPLDDHDIQGEVALPVDHLGELDVLDPSAAVEGEGHDIPVVLGQAAVFIGDGHVGVLLDMGLHHGDQVDVADDVGIAYH